MGKLILQGMAECDTTHRSCKSSICSNPSRADRKGKFFLQCTKLLMCPQWRLPQQHFYLKLFSKTCGYLKVNYFKFLDA